LPIVLCLMGGENGRLLVGDLDVAEMCGV